MKQSSWIYKPKAEQSDTERINKDHGGFLRHHTLADSVVIV